MARFCPRKKKWLLEGRVPAFKLRWHRLWKYRDERRTSFIAEESRPTGASYLFPADFYPWFSAVAWLTDWPMHLLEKSFFQDWFLCTVGLYGIVHCSDESYKSESVRSWLSILVFVLHQKILRATLDGPFKRVETRPDPPHSPNLKCLKQIPHGLLFLAAGNISIIWHP